MIIDINIEDKRAAAVGAPTIVCGNSGYTIKFTFDDEWKIVSAKTARFVYVQDGEVKYIDVVFTGFTVSVPVMSNTKEVRVGVFAGNLQTTTPARIPCEPSIRCGTGAPADPTPSQYDQIMALLRAGGGGSGGTGGNGKSAYEIALDNGFEGSEAEWLESLKGVSPKVEVEGYGIPGKSSANVVTITDAYGEKKFVVPDGKSAYAIALDNGFEGSEAEWLESLKGVSPTVQILGLSSTDPDRRDGTQVTITDVNGKDSFQVYDGKSAYEIALDNGFEGSKEEWLESLKGVSPTVAVEKFTDDESGGHIVKITDATGTKQFTVNNGRDVTEMTFPFEDRHCVLQVGDEGKVRSVKFNNALFNLGEEGLELTPVTGTLLMQKMILETVLTGRIWFDVRTFGAQGDGETDDGWAIQTAIDRCKDMGGGTVYFPKGTYNITRTLFYYSNMTFKFEEGAVIRTATDSSTRLPSIVFAPYFDTSIAYLNSGAGTSGFTANRYAVENVVFEGGTISGYSWNGSSVNTSPSSVVLLTCLCRNIKFYNMKFDGNSGGHSIEINSSTDVTVRDCKFTNFVSSPGTMNANGNRNYNGGMYAENLQIDAATSAAIGSKYTIHENTGKAPNGVEYEKWYTYSETKDSSDNTITAYRSLGGYFDFTLLPPGDQYSSHHQPIIEAKLSKTAEQIESTPGFHQCCHNIEIASCYFENNQDSDCFVSAIGCHTSFNAANESQANLNQDKHTGIKIHDNTFIWATNRYHVGVRDDATHWRGVIAFGTNESVSGKAFKNVHVYNVSIHGNMFYRNSACLIDENQPTTGYAITANRDDIRYVSEHSNMSQSKYRIYGNFYAGINGWETAATLYQNGNALVIE